jgi:translation initiation factor IF-1
MIAGTMAVAQPITKSQSTTVTATVEAIDRTDRMVTLKTTTGESVTTSVSPEMKRFDTLKVGDKVSITYYESLLAQVEKPGEAPFKTGDAVAVNPAPGAKPGGSVGRQIKATVTVEEIVNDPPTITVRGEKGRVVSFRVKDPKVLSRLKKGDRVDVTYTEAFLLKIE